MKYLFFIFGIFLLQLIVLQTPVSAEGQLRAGAAAVEISPRLLPAVSNGGFLQATRNRIADPLFARALVVSDGKETIAIVVVDSCMFSTTLCDEIKRMAANETGIPVNRILISATHTHSAPSVLEMCLGCGADEAYVKFVPARVAQAIADAHERRQSAKFGWAVVEAPRLTNCRRWITRSDRMGTDPFGEQTVRAMMHPGYQNPDYTSPAGPIDPWLSVLSVVSAEDESPICVMANLSMHYFGSGDGFSADYFGEVARLLEARIGDTSDRPTPGVVGVMSQGTSGDLHWMDYSQPQRGISRQQYSEAVADQILRAWETIEHRGEQTLAMKEKRITLDRRTPSRGRREWARPINVGRGELAPRNIAEVYAQQVEWIHENPTVEVVLQAVRIGDLGITAMPTETYGITGLKLKRQSPLAATFNLELSNGAVGYIPPPEQHRLGGYTTWPARTAGLSEQSEPEIVETLLGLLETVTGNQRRAIVDPEMPYSEKIVQKQPLAYWRLDDLYSNQAQDGVGENHGQYVGGVALFLPGPDGSGMTTTEYGNRSVYLAGGHLECELDLPGEQYSIAMWFLNSLPAHARDTTGVLFASGADTLWIAGRKAGDRSGRLVLRSGQQSFVGKTPISTGYWQQIVMVRDGHRVRVYLDGRSEPEIDAETDLPNRLERLLIGSDGATGPTFDGKIDEVALFARALPPADVVELYNVSGVSRPPRPKPAPRPKPTIVLGPKPTDKESRQRYADVIRASNPIAYWRLHDEGTRTARDSVDRNDGTYEQGAFPMYSDIVKQNFTNGRVRASVPELGNTYSVEFWFRNNLPVNSRPVTAYLFSRAVNGIAGADGDNLGIGGSHSNAGRLLVFNGNRRNELLAGPTRLTPGSWSYVVMVRAEEHVTVYLNGDPDPEIDAKLPIGYPDRCGDFFLGGRADQFANLQGMLEEFAIYDRALKPDEVKVHFDAAGVQHVETPVPVENNPPERPSPMDVGQSIKAIHVPQDFEVQLIAAEPLVMDPVAIDWGPDGKLWVVEMADYPLGVDGQGKPGGRVRFLEDTNDDGQYDKSTLFVEGLSFPNGVLAWGRGVLVTAAPEILYLEDRTGDGKADTRQVLYSGFLEGNQQLRVNGLRWGLDNWVYCASGSHHGGYGKNSRITSRRSGEKCQVGSRDFRIRPDTGEIDPQSGPSQYGRSRDDWGNWFGVQNSHPLWHYVLDDHNIRRNSHFAPPDPKHQVVTPSNPVVYPASKLQKRFHSFSQSGRFTSACSAMIYRDDYLFEQGSEQHAFTCEPFHNLVQHNLIADAGVSFRFRRDPAEVDTDFFASEDRWCRPVMARTGPDGALWVVDMYRYMIEHPQWLPQNGKDELRPWYRFGEDRGRIYRVIRREQPPRDIPQLVRRTAEELVATLENPNGWQRDMAHRMLVRGQLRTVVSRLNTMAKSSQQPRARVHAFWTLEGLGALSAAVFEAALSDPHSGVRQNALRVAASGKADIRWLEPMVDDADAKVLLELACALGAYEDPKASVALAKLAVASCGDPYIVAAVMSSLTPENVLDVLTAVMQSTDDTSQQITLTLIGQVVAMSDSDEIARVIAAVSAQPNEQAGKRQFESLSEILDGLANLERSISELSKSAQARIVVTIQQARIAAANATTGEDTRAAAIRLLGRDDDRKDDDLQLMQDLLVPQSSALVQQSVLVTLAGRSEPSVAKVLLSGWRSHSPALRNQILEILTRRKSWAASLHASLESGVVHAGELNASIRQRLLESGDDSSVWPKSLAVKTSKNRAAVLRQFQPALELGGDEQRGEAIFRKTCLNCHKLGDEGFEVGPQLVSITDKSKAALFNSVLDPNASVDAKYYNYVVICDDGRTYSGRLETETGSSITLLTVGGKRETILRRDIEELQASRKSLMPEGLEEGLTIQDVADLIYFVRRFKSRETSGN